MYDSHWTAPGAIAAFNTIVAADGHKDWTIDPATALGPVVARTTLDVARVAGVEKGLSEPNRELSLSGGRREADLSPGPMPDHVQVSGRPGPTVMVIGDFFTTDLFTTLLVQHVARAIWINHQRCGFDWKWIDVYHPDEVWWMPTERFLNCSSAPGRSGSSADDREPPPLFCACRRDPDRCAADHRPHRARQSFGRAEGGAAACAAPGWPASGAEWPGLPAAFDAYLKDHFGLRQAMIRAHKDLTKPMLGAGSDSVLVGRDGRMFYLGEEAVRQSAGLVLRDERVAELVDLVVAMKAALAKRGVRFLVAVPPNSSTVYQDDLPDWAQNHGRRTEYDLFLDGLAARRVKTVDLRPVMAKARAEGAAYYRHDTHWTAFGALAAFNAVVEADGRPTGGSIRPPRFPRRRRARAAISPGCSASRTPSARRSRSSGCPRARSSS